MASVTHCNRSARSIWWRVGIPATAFEPADNLEAAVAAAESPDQDEDEWFCCCEDEDDMVGVWVAARAVSLETFRRMISNALESLQDTTRTGVPRGVFRASKQSKYRIRSFLIA
jgi:hypothetical protein